MRQVNVGRRVALAGVALVVAVSGACAAPGEVAPAERASQPVASPSPSPSVSLAGEVGQSQSVGQWVASVCSTLGSVGTTPEVVRSVGTVGDVDGVGVAAATAGQWAQDYFTLHGNLVSLAAVDVPEIQGLAEAAAVMAAAMSGEVGALQAAVRGAPSPDAADAVWQDMVVNPADDGGLLRVREAYRTEVDAAFGGLESVSAQTLVAELSVLVEQQPGCATAWGQWLGL